MPEEPDLTPLALKIGEQIARQGVMPVLEYMHACLHDPQHGYYRRRQAIGAEGDFTTAPEISQMFGELIGVWAGVAWRAMGAPARLELVELGPGRGTMISDALRAGRIVPGFLGALRIHLVESNRALKEAQRRALAAATAGLAVHWHEALDQALPGDGPTIVLANEFLDALPVRQLVFDGVAWRERSVGLDANGRLALVTGPPAGTVDVPSGRGPREGDIFELRPGLDELADVLGRSQRPLVALFIDYGHAAGGFGETLQAIRRQRHVPILERPGETDLSAHVDFEDLARRLRERGLAVDGPITQAEFLLGLGLAERAARLMAGARPGQIGLIEAGARRICDPAGMGGRFKVACARSAALPVLPPFPPAARQGGP